MKNFEYRAHAREALKGQWGINAGIIFLIGLITGVIEQAADSLTNFPDDSLRLRLLSFGLSVVIFFAFTYAQYYVGLQVARGRRADIGDIFSIFQGSRYFPMAIINFVNTIVSTLLGMIIYIPVFLVVGIGAYTAVASGKTYTAVADVLADSPESVLLFLAVMLVTILIYFLINSIISGVFRFAVWAKLDHPELSAGQAIRYGWFLLKDRMGQFVMLNLSFVGWYIVGFLALIFGILWVAVYMNVSTASFYEQAVREKGDPKF